jgi:predicted nucleic acid-binding protein
VSKVFVDTNVFVYALDFDQPAKQRVAQEAIESLEASGQGVTSTQVMQELYAVITRKKGINPVLAKTVVQKLENMEVVVVTPEIIADAMDCSILGQVSFWDALIIVSAESAMCDTLWSEDMQHNFVIRGVRVENPFA